MLIFKKNEKVQSGRCQIGENMDILIHNARIVDGTGAPWFRGFAGVEGDRLAIVQPGDPETSLTETARLVVDANGACLSPGFIDCHTHLDLAILGDPLQAGKLRQGITTVVTGACGFSAAPLAAANEQQARRELVKRNLAFIAAGVQADFSWTTFAQWLDRLEMLDLGLNVASHVGHGTLRTAVMGFDDRAPTQAELNHMIRLLEDSLDAGARGMTSGLVYTPGIFSVPHEFETLAKVLARRGRLYETHMRNESDHVQKYVAENVALARRTGAMVQISHLKASGRPNFGKSWAMLELITAARAHGLDVTFNQHPYRIGSTTLRAILPGWAQEGGFAALCDRLQNPQTRTRIHAEVSAGHSDWDNYYRNSGGAQGIILLNTPATPELEGKVLADAAGARDPLELAFDLIIANNGEDAAAFDNMDEVDIERIMAHPAGILASDSIPGAPGAKTHPRLCGAFVRVLDHYVRQRHVISLEEAVRRMTHAPAMRCGLSERGSLRPGYYADLTLFQPEAVRDNTTFTNPHAAPDGIELVVVNGTIAVTDGKLAAEQQPRSGRVLRG